MLTERQVCLLVWIPVIFGHGQVELEVFQERFEIERSSCNCAEEIKKSEVQVEKKMEDLENQNKNLQEQFNNIQSKLNDIMDSIRVDGAWGPFLDWSQCSATCGGGVQIRNRNCNNPVPKNGGKTCTGEAVEQRTCNAHLCNDCDVGERYESNCYQLVSTLTNWHNAQADCTRRNGSLASIPNIETSYFVAHIAGGGTMRAWIGASDAETEGSWKWTNGEIATFTNWSNGNPDNRDGIQHCAVINYETVSKWDDDSCWGLYPYVCQGQNMTKDIIEADNFRVIGGYRGLPQRVGPFSRSDTADGSCTSEISTLSSFSFKYYKKDMKTIISKMVVVEEISSSACTKWVSFGFRGSEAWVDKGCRAKFSFLYCTGSLKLDNEVPYLLIGSKWMPICGHYFWDNNNGANIVCQSLGYSKGGVLVKERKPYSEDAYYVGRCDSSSITDLINGCTKEQLAAQYSCEKGRPVSIKVKCKGYYG